MRSVDARPEDPDARPVVPDAPVPPDAPPPDAPSLCDGPAHLVLSEVAAGSTGEFVEFCNPNPCAVDLGNYYITDAENFAAIADGQDPEEVVGGLELLARLPDGARLDADDRVAVFAVDGMAFEETYADIFGGAELYVLKNRGTVGTLVAESHSGDRSELLSNTDDAVVLFWWDGVSSSVTEIDVMAYCSDGGDNGCREVMTGSGKAIAELFNGNSLTYRRIAKEAGFETQTGGNGVGGHDERSEDLTKTWDNEVGGQYPDNPTPGNPFGGVCAP